MIEMVDESFDIFYNDHGFGPAVDEVRIPASTIKLYRGKLPEKLIAYWEAYGWSGYGDGLFWITNPADYSDVLNAWVSHSDAYGKDKYHVIARSAFGKLYVWGERTGQSLTINAPWSSIVPSDDSSKVAQGKADRLLGFLFSSRRREDLDQSDENEIPLFDRAVKLLGRPGPDEMFGFVPALALGGPCRLDHLQKVKAVEHLMFLAQVQPPRVMLDIVREAKKQGLM